MPSRRILIVDDDPDTVDALRILLENCGELPAVAHNVPDALASAKAEPPDVVLMDLALPRVEDGLELARRLRKETDAYIVCLTGYARAEDRQRATAAGCHAFVVKPADTEELLRLIEEAPTVACPTQV